MSVGMRYGVGAVVVKSTKSEAVVRSHKMTSSRQSPNMSALIEGVFLEPLQEDTGCYSRKST